MKSLFPITFAVTLLFFSNIAFAESFFSESEIYELKTDKTEFSTEERFEKLEEKISNLTNKIDQLLEKRNTLPAQEVVHGGAEIDGKISPAFTTQNNSYKNDDDSHRVTPEKWYKEAVLSLLYEGEYDKAEGELNTFITMYNKHPLVHEAHYWLGEINYTNKKFNIAQKEFMLAYTLNPKGEKGSESLLKMAMSYSEMQKPDKACAALAILTDDFPESNAALRVKAGTEFAFLNCERYTLSSAYKTQE